MRFSNRRTYRLSVPVFYGIGNFVPDTIKTLRDAHPREDVLCRRRPRPERECAKAHSFLVPVHIAVPVYKTDSQAD